MTAITVLGAEVQAASSLAGAYPERDFTFVSDKEILDGWDLPNVRFKHMLTSEEVGADGKTIALCPRWVPDGHALAVSHVTTRLKNDCPDHVLPVLDAPQPVGKWIAKGDRFHKPDAPAAGSRLELSDLRDESGCGLVYQPFVDARRRYAAIGRRRAGGAVSIGILAVLQERFFRDAILQAGETVDDPTLLSISLDILDVLGHRGFFTINWLDTPSGPKMSSFRPVPRAVFGTFLRGGIDLLAEPAGVAVCRPGLRFISTPHYSSYGVSAR